MVEILPFVVVGAVVSLTAHLATRQQSVAARSRFESQLLGRLAGEPLSDLTAEDVLAQMRTTLALDALTLVRSDDPDAALATVSPRDGRTRRSLSIPYRAPQGAGQGRP